MTANLKKDMLENHKRDAKALFSIQSMRDVSIFPKIVECKTSKEAWEILETTYKGSTKVPMENI